MKRRDISLTLTEKYVKDLKEAEPMEKSIECKSDNKANITASLIHVYKCIKFNLNENFISNETTFRTYSREQYTKMEDNKESCLACKVQAAFRRKKHLNHHKYIITSSYSVLYLMCGGVFRMTINR
uniref:Uncharacterized protein n=1 Tax=Glossina austeni TaxID=7395 RepID=A0A1A9VYV4_GLOAU